MNRRSSYEADSAVHEQNQSPSALSVMSNVLEGYKESLLKYGFDESLINTDYESGFKSLYAYVNYLKSQKEQSELSPQERDIVDAYSARKRYVDAFVAYGHEMEFVSPEDLMSGGYVYEEASTQRANAKGVPGKRKEYLAWCETLKRIGDLSEYKSLLEEGCKDNDLLDELLQGIYPSSDDDSLLTIMDDLLLNQQRADGKYAHENRIGNVSELFADVRRETINLNSAVELHEFVGSTVRRHNVDAERSESSRRQEAAADKAREDVDRAFTGAEENKESIIMPQDWKERQDFVKEWFAKHDPNQITPDNLEVVRKYFAQEIEMQARGMRRAREKHPDMSAARYAGNVAGIFGTGFTIGGDFRPVDVVVIRKLQRDGVIKEISTGQYAGLRIETVAKAIGLDVYELTKDYDSIFQRTSASSKKSR